VEAIAQQLGDALLSECTRFWCIGWKESRHTPLLVVYEHKSAPEGVVEVEPLQLLQSFRVVRSRD